MKYPLLQAIKGLVRSEFQQDGLLVLEETDPGSTCGKITLTKSGPHVALKLDGLPPPVCKQPSCLLRYSVPDRLFPLFRIGVPDLTALCDYLIFYPYGAEEDPSLFVFLCELKSGSSTSAPKQVANGKLLADYILAMAQHHGRLGSLPRIEARGLIFSPRHELPKILDPVRSRCSYGSPSPSHLGLRFTRCRAASPGTSYPLDYFCS